MTKSKRAFVGLIIALFLAVAAVVPALANGRNIRVSPLFRPIIIQCDGAPGHCPCPGC